MERSSNCSGTKIKEIEERKIELNEKGVLNGDGASWIKATCKEENIHFQLDPFHISQAIVRKVSDKKERKKLLKLFREGKVEEGLQTIVDMMINTDEDDSRFKLMNLWMK